MNIEKMVAEAQKLSTEMGEVMEQAEKKVQAARSRVILAHRFVAALALRMPCIADGRCPTMWTDGNVMGYDPLFVNSITTDELVGVVAHEVWHTVLMHHLRRGERDPEVWNIAADHVVNLIITQSDPPFTLPFEPKCDKRFAGMSTEQVYDIVYKENPPKPQDKNGKSKPCAGGEGGKEGDDFGKCGEVRDWTPKDEGKGDGKNGKKSKKPRKPSKAELREAEAIMKRRIIQAATVAKQCGNLPAELQRLIKEATAPKTNSLEIISCWATELAKDDYSWRRPNRRYHDSSFILPALRSENPGTCGFFIDTSGSMSEKELNEAASELQGILRRDGIKALVIYCDSEVAKVEEITPDDMPLKLKAMGGGGTDFCPPFEYVRDKEVELCGAVYFTDGYCSSFPDPPDYPVLWILSSSAGTYGGGFKPPFGTVIRMPSEG